MKKFHLLYILMVLVSSLGGYSQQVKSFSNNSEKYLEEITDLLLKTTEEKKAMKIMMEDFALMWNGGTISDDQKHNVTTVSNLLLDKRALTFPHLKDYITIVYLVFKTSHNLESYNDWEKGLRYLISEKKKTLRNVETYLDQSKELLKSNSIYKSSTTEWRASNNKYRFKFDKTIKIIFDEMDLICYAKRDSACIYKTKGVFYPFDEFKWEGTGGKVTWDRAGYGANEIYVTLGPYKIKMEQAKYNADSVTFVNTLFFKQPLLGKFEEKVTDIVNVEEATYPHFESYTKRFQIKSIYPNVDFDGGYRQEGAKFVGSGSNEEPAKLFFYRNGQLFLTAASKFFALRKDRVVGSNTAITFRLDTDSIFHPGLSFKYFVDKHRIDLIRDGEGLSRTPFFNSYHNVDMDFELLTWNIDDPKMDFEMMKGTTNTKAFFKSSDYFRLSTYDNIQGMDASNPILLIKQYCAKNKTETFPSTDLANFMRADLAQTRQILLRLTFMGLLDYDYETDMVTVKKRLYHYVNSRAGKEDYDVISFMSDSKDSSNASLNLLNNEMKIHGVPEIYLSDSQKVVIYPENQEILLRANRDFDFAGKIIAGLFIFSGKNFVFEYDKFKINLNNVDSLRIMVPTGELDYQNKPILKNCRTLIESITGDLLIDNPKNKSGVKSFPQYPIFNSKKDSYVYYDRRSILGGVYSRDKFYFQVYPYTIDSLDNFTTAGLKFKGYFVSGGIFPPFEENLSVQKDYSLGFIRSTPPAGFPLYGGKGSFHNEIKLSHKGLRGDGDFNYVTSTTSSKDFIFFPDSMTTLADKFVVKKQSAGVEFPSVEGLSVDIRFLPFQDELYSTKVEVPQTMYDGMAVMNGTLKLEPTGLSGWGQVDFSKSELTSNLIKFKETTFDADTSTFKLKAADLSGFAFITENVNAHIDFNQRKGEFKSNGEGSIVEFPQNQYKCFMDQFSWYMDQGDIEVTSSNSKTGAAKDTTGLSPTEKEDIQLEGSRFFSTHPDQDSLAFVAPSAKYNLFKHIISASEVKYIRVADATVWTSDGIVTIEKNAKMRTLSNARIVANNTLRYHTIYNATVNIFGAKNYTADGDYDYTDETGTKQKIHFDAVSVDTTYQTVATGKIGITDNFTLSPDFSYTGKIQLYAPLPFLTFDGSTKIAHKCDMLEPVWFNFTSEIDPKQIYIPVTSKLSDINGTSLGAGVMITSDSSYIYTSFLTKLKNVNDLPVLPAEGFLFFDKSSKKYKISNKEKLVEMNMPGNYLSLHSEFCNIFGEGKINFGTDLGQVKLTTVGNISHDLAKDHVSMELMMGVNFFFEDQLLKMMAEGINGDVTLEATDLSTNNYKKGLLELIGKEASDKILSEISLYGAAKKIPKEMEYSLFLSNFTMVWNTKTHSYRSSGKIGVGNILKVQVNKFLNGYVEIRKKRSGDIIDIYLKVDDANWYFFEYKNAQMYALSSNAEFNKIIKELKSDKRKLEVEKGQKQYAFYIGSETTKEKFLKRFAEGNENPDENEDQEEKDKN